jgi:hypothetical protein
MLSEDNNQQIDLKERIKNANKTYFMLQNFLKSEKVTERQKLRLNNTKIDKTLTYASELGY